MEDLFVQPTLEFEKSASGAIMPEDPNSWPSEILGQIFKQAPYLTDYAPHVVMDRTDGERGYAFGHVEIVNQSELQTGAPPDVQAAAGLRQVRVPVVIRDGTLCALDLLITDDSKMLPLTESRLRAAIFRPQAFDITGKMPGDQSMIGQLYPPFRQNFGGGGGSVMPAGDMGKMGSKEASFLSKVLRTGKKTARTLGDEAGHAAGQAAKSEAAGVGRTAGRSAGKAAVKGAGEGLKEFGQKHKGKLIAGGAGAVAAKGGYDYYRDKRLAKNIVGEFRKQGSVLQAILPTINVSDLENFKDAILQDAQVKLAYEQNASATLPALQMLLEHEPIGKVASVIAGLVRPTVVQVCRVDRGHETEYHVKEASHVCWEPQVRVVSRPQVVEEFGTKVAIAADTSGAATITEGAAQPQPAQPQPETQPDSDTEQLGPVAEAGLYKVQTEEGKELIGYVIPNLVDVDGTEVPIALFTNGSEAAVQTDILGVPVDAQVELPTADTPAGHGAFFVVEGDDIRATVPMTLAGSFGGVDPNEPVIYQAETFDGQKIEVSVQPNIQTVIGSPEGRMLVPQHWQWLPMDKANEVALAGSEPEVAKGASARDYIGAVDVVAGGSTYSFRGPAVDKLAHVQREFLDVDDAMFLMAGLGVHPEQGIQKLAEALSGSASVQIPIGRFIKTAEEQKKAAMAAAKQTLGEFPNWRRSLIKEAAVISNPEAVDTVLSLGFINPENIMTFLGYMPELDETQSKLCELLLAARLGMSEVPEDALSKAIRTLEEVLVGLKTLTFQGPGEYS